MTKSLEHSTKGILRAFSYYQPLSSQLYPEKVEVLRANSQAQHAHMKHHIENKNSQLKSTNLVMVSKRTLSKIYFYIIFISTIKALF